MFASFAPLEEDVQARTASQDLRMAMRSSELQQEVKRRGLTELRSDMFNMMTYYRDERGGILQADNTKYPIKFTATDMDTAIHLIAINAPQQRN